MNFWTIWTIPMEFSERLNRTGEWAARTIASKLPKRVKYWATLQEIGKATKDSPNVPATTLDTILQKL